MRPRHPFRAFVLALCLAPALLATGASGAAAAPRAELWPRWQAHDPASTATIDHSAWQALLARYLVRGDDGISHLRYGEVSPGDRTELDDYVARLSGLPISTYDRAEQMAYWINLYNALTVRLVLEHQPIDTIGDIDLSPGLLSSLLGRGPWDQQLITIEGAALSLNDIEHRILRAIWRDPRIHYAVNCAARGCPNLQPEPFQADRLAEQLDRAARQYVNHPRGVDIAGNELIVSGIYEWFKEDFGGTDRAVIAHLMRFAEPNLAAKLARFSSIDGDRYDWSLNGVRSSRAVKPS